MNITETIRRWQRRFPKRDMPIVYEMTETGNFIYQFHGQNIGFAFGCAGRPTSCYWLSELRDLYRIPDASNEYVSQEKIDSLINSCASTKSSQEK